MKQIYKFYCCVMSLLLLVACQEEELMDKTAGFRISLQDMDVSIDTKSTPAELSKPLEDQFKLKIVKDGTSVPLYDGVFTNQTISATAGTYTITASHGENSILALDAPYYWGEQSNVTIKDGEKKTVTVSCKVANALASAFFPAEEEMKKIYSSYWVEVSIEQTTCRLTPNSQRSAYFQANKQIAFYFKGEKTNGDKFSELLKHQDLPGSLKAGEHLKLTLQLSDDLLLDIAKVEIKKETITTDIPMDWLPKPKVVAEGFENNRLEFVETESKVAKLNFNIASALQDLKFKFKFDDLPFSSLNDKEYVLSNPEDKAMVEDVLGVTLPQVGTDKASLDLTPLIGKLQTNAGVTVENTIEVDVKANNRWSSEEISGQDNPSRVYILQCNKPIFRVSAYPGNIWTKEFTMNPLMENQVESGNFTTLSNNMKYQYSLDGQSDWIDIESDLRQADLSPGTKYYIRGLYRGEVSSEVAEVKTYETVAIPNSTLDDGYETSYPKNKNPLYSFSGGWIGTRNPLTCHAGGINAFYVSKSSTLPVNENGSTVAHMMTIGWGVGNTCDFGNKTGSIIKNISAGLICVGDYSAQGDTIKPKAAYIRPTSLSFVYKASPYKGDEYLISISLLNIAEDGVEVEVGKGELISGETVNSYTTKDIPIVYDEVKKEYPITHLKVVFKAGTKEDRDHLEDKFRDANFPYAKAYIIGSQFWLDSFVLHYDK